MENRAKIAVGVLAAGAAIFFITRETQAKVTQIPATTAEAQAIILNMAPNTIVPPDLLSKAGIYTSTPMTAGEYQTLVQGDIYSRNLSADLAAKVLSGEIPNTGVYQVGDFEVVFLPTDPALLEIIAANDPNIRVAGGEIAVYDPVYDSNGNLIAGWHAPGTVWDWATRSWVPG